MMPPGHPRLGSELVPLCQICTPVGMLGYGFEERSLREHLQFMTSTNVRTAMILDSGSTDSGPSKLALGTKTCPDASYKSDLTKLIRASLEFGVPILVSSVGGSGANEHVDSFLRMVREITMDLKSGRNLKVLTIYSEISKEVIMDKLASNMITGCGAAVPPLTAKNIDETPRILAQMGPGPILDAMTEHPDFDIVLVGRAYDPAPYVAYCMWCMGQSGYAETNEDKFPANILGGFYHMGKIMECGGICAQPKSRGARATVYKNGTFEILPMDTNARCTPLSVAAHTLYEMDRPDILHGPGGALDLRKATYEALKNDSRGTRVTGSHFITSAQSSVPWTVKLEGARMVGHRTLFMGSFRDPILISQIDDFLASGRKKLHEQYPDLDGQWKLDFHKYGQSSSSPEEIFVVGEALADSQQLATSIASAARVNCTHGSYAGQLGTGGNFAFGLGGAMELPVGPCCEFSVYHLMTVTPGERKGQATTETVKSIVSRSHASNGLFVWHASSIAASKTPHVGSLYPSTLNARGPAATRASPNTSNSGRILHTNNPKTLEDIAKVIRSKNAGPYEITFDVMFDDMQLYDAVKRSNILAPHDVASLFGRQVDQIIWCGFFDQAMAFKVTFPRWRGSELACSGGYMENDVHGSQQYMPLLHLRLNSALISEIQKMRRQYLEHADSFIKSMF